MNARCIFLNSIARKTMLFIGSMVESTVVMYDIVTIVSDNTIVIYSQIYNIHVSYCNTKETSSLHVRKDF